jgi:hypothetical protein
LDKIDHLKSLVAKHVNKLGPNVTINRTVEIVVARLGRHPGPDHEADEVLHALIGNLARATYQEAAFRHVLSKLPDEVQRAYDWQDID